MPVEAKLRSYRWSSYPCYLVRPRKRPAWLRVDRVLGEMGIPKDGVAGRRELEKQSACPLCNPDSSGATTNRLRIVEVRGSLNRTNDFEVLSATSRWIGWCF